MEPTPFESTRSDATDFALVALTAAFGALPTGPAAVVVLFTHLAHWGLWGRPRAALAPVYLGLLLAVAAFRSDGLLEWPAVQQVAARAALVLAAALALVFDRLLCPLRGRVPAPTGRHDTAVIVVSSVGDFQLRIYYPTPRRSAEERAKEARRLRVPPPAQAPYFLQGTAPVAAGAAAALDLPSALFVSWLGETRPWSLQGSEQTPCSKAPEGGFRVVVLSHSLTSTPDFYGGLISEVVSHGYIVAAIEHADGSAAFTRRHDGAAVDFMRLTAEERRNPRKEFQLRRRQLRERVDEMRSCADALQEIASRPYDPRDPDADAQNEGESDDMLLARMLLCGKFAPVQLGVPRTLLTCIGHSLGGATCITALEEDRRFGAAVLYDPWLFPLSATTLSRGVAHAPVLTLIGDTWRESASFMSGARLLFDAAFRRSFLKESKGSDAGEGEGVDGLDIVGSNGISAKDGAVDPKFFVRSAAVHPGSAVALLSGLRHYSFTDGAVLAEAALRFAGKIGSRPGADVHRIVSRLTLGFLTNKGARVPAKAVADDLGVNEAAAASFDVMGTMASTDSLRAAAAAAAAAVDGKQRAK
jgi:alpha-beta hydrolase superfamily lysophospholipase